MGEMRIMDIGPEVTRSLAQKMIDCVVLTQEEYFNLKRESFNDGLRHAAGYVHSNVRLQKVDGREEISDDSTMEGT